MRIQCNEVQFYAIIIQVASRKTESGLGQAAGLCFVYIKYLFLFLNLVMDW